MSDLKDFKIDEIEKTIDEYEIQQGISFGKKKPNELPYFDISLEELRKYSLDKLSNAIFELNRYSLYVQRIINKNRAFERWALSKIDDIAAENLDNVDRSMGWNERMLCAKTRPEGCKKLNKFVRELRLKNDKLYDMPNAINNMANAIRDIKFSIINREKNEQKDNQS